MSRPKKNEKGYEEANARWRATMEAKYGGKEALHKHMIAMGKKGGSLSVTGGFASDKVGADGLTGPERARLAGKIGGQRSKRGPAKPKDEE